MPPAIIIMNTILSYPSANRLPNVRRLVVDWLIINILVVSTARPQGMHLV